MIEWSCARAQSQLDQRARSSEAERLELESHLEECATCRGYASWIDEARKTLDETTRPLSDRARDRILARAMNETELSIAPAHHRRRVASAALVFAVAAVVALGVMLARPETHDVDPQVAVDDATDPSALPRPRSLGPDVTTLAVGEERATGHAVVWAVGEARARFDAERATVELVSGELEVDVDPRPRRPFAIVADGLTVRVLGTHFTVSATEVRVTRGVVEVDLEGDDVAAVRLEAGDSWRRPEPTIDVATSTASVDATERSATGQPSTGPSTEPSTEPSTTEPSTNEPSTTPRPNADRPTPARPAVDPAALLESARTAIAARRLDEAVATIASALDGRPTRAHRAEATTLQAEIAIVRGDRRSARRLYLEVGRNYPELPAGDLALYAAVRLEAGLGSPASERALLDEYLATYPRGRFRSQTQRRQGELAGTEQP